MHPADIICALSKAGYSQTQIAQYLGVHKSAVNQVIHGGSSSYNIASHIAAVTHIPLSRLWPDGRYDVSPVAAQRRVSVEPPFAGDEASL